jgi:hypothetical protein
MPSLSTDPPQLPLVAVGTVLGAFSWLAASLISGTFEPYDSSAGLLANQAILTIPAVYLALRHRPTAPILFLAGAYLGMNAYAYVFGGSEQRVWVALGAAVSLLLVVGPALFASGAAVLRHFRKPTHE